MHLKDESQWNRAGGSGQKWTEVNESKRMWTDQRSEDNWMRSLWKKSLGLYHNRWTENALTSQKTTNMEEKKC